MSHSFRAVKEIWNAHSSCFIEPEKLIVLLHDLAARVGTASDEHEYGDNQVVWLENGRTVLDYIEADERFSAASFKDSMKEQGVAVNGNDLVTLIDNMRSLSKQWRSSIGKHGELVLKPGKRDMPVISLSGAHTVSRLRESATAYEHSTRHTRCQSARGQDFRVSEFALVAAILSAHQSRERIVGCGRAGG
jgi:hypothetical protein